MAVSGEVTIDHDGRVKLHPYLIALADRRCPILTTHSLSLSRNVQQSATHNHHRATLARPPTHITAPSVEDAKTSFPIQHNTRWCVSCLWSSATAMLYRLLANPLPQILASKPSKARPAGKEHLHPEPRVECVVLHQPSAPPKVDVIFVHGLYGSLGNTWRQGEWRSKYKIEPNKITLRRPSSIATCDCVQSDSIIEHVNGSDNEHADCKREEQCTEDNNAHKEKYRTNDRDITFTNIDEFYKKSITDDEMFITEKFYKEVERCEVIDNYETQAKFVRDLFTLDNLKEEKKVEVDVACSCRKDAKRCEVGCGCICDECYSSCWPRDWIKVDYPEARVMSVNYTSDPHLWRPLWIKESKRLQLHERAEQMIEQLLSLGVGERPIVWVGHSKGGLFIKQIYCEAYEAYIKLNGQTDEQSQNCDEYDKDNAVNHKTDSIDNTDAMIDNNNRSDAYKQLIDTDNMDIYEQIYDENLLNYEESKISGNSFKDMFNDDCRNCNIYNDMASASEGEASDASISLVSSNEEEEQALSRRASLWRRSAGFVFYSVPHRGSPLADIRTPVTARSVELLEMGQDCAVVRRLQRRWARAARRSGRGRRGGRGPLVRSLVETNRTLMAVLWLRIVSVDSADAGIGALCGVSVDHREICKPSSRHCILYTELTTLIRAALDKCPQCS